MTCVGGWYRSLETLYFCWYLPMRCTDEYLIFDKKLSFIVGMLSFIHITLLIMFYIIFSKSEEMRMQSLEMGMW